MTVSNNTFSKIAVLTLGVLGIGCCDNSLKEFDKAVEPYVDPADFVDGKKYSPYSELLKSQIRTSEVQALHQALNLLDLESRVKQGLKEGSLNEVYAKAANHRIISKIKTKDQDRYTRADIYVNNLFEAYSLFQNAKKQEVITEEQFRYLTSSDFLHTGMPERDNFSSGKNTKGSFLCNTEKLLRILPKLGESGEKLKDQALRCYDHGLAKTILESYLNDDIGVKLARVLLDSINKECPEFLNVRAYIPLTWREIDEIKNKNLNILSKSRSKQIVY